MLPTLPLTIDVETKAVLRKTAHAHKALAELKGILNSIPNQQILLETLTLQEAKESSAIENIISTFAEVYQSNLFAEQFASPAAKEIHMYAKALKAGFQSVKEKGLLTNRQILEVQELVEGNKAGFRKLPGTKLVNDVTGETIYTPPQDEQTILTLMQNLEQFINDDSMMDADPLVKMAIIHHQFESIHPFYDGNGRTGRILNILYLVKQQLLDLPVLYHSRYIIQNKSDYYRLLQQVRIKGDWEEWILYMLNGLEKTAAESIALIKQILLLMQQYKFTLREKMAKFYSQELLNNLFKYPYTKIEYFERDLDVSRSTAIRYLAAIEKLGLLKKQKIGRDNFYVNTALFNLLANTRQ